MYHKEERPLSAIQREENLNLLAQCYASTEKMAKFFFPERFSRPFSDALHRQIFNLVDDPSIRKLAIAAPRCCGKTSICNLAIPAKKILFQECRYVVQVSCSASAAIEQAENLKFQFETNELIQKNFGILKTDEWARDRWTTSSGVRVFPRGAGQQVRGLLFRDARPDLIIVDDLENAEEVESEEQRMKKEKWFFSDLLGCVDLGSTNWKIIVLGTILHQNSLLQKLIDMDGQDGWRGVRLELCDDNFNSNWPEYMTDQEVKDKYTEMRNAGHADDFFREYRNLPISTEDATFRMSYFKYYEEKDHNFLQSPFVETFVICDPAKTVEKHSCESAIVGISIDSKNNLLYIRDIVSGKFHPDQMYEEMFSMCKRLRAVVLGVEVTSLNEFITYPIRNEILRRGLNIELVELKARGKKEDRVAALVPFYRMGQIFHNKSNCTALEQQLLSFPRAKLWDIMDAVAYGIEMLEMGNRFFSLRGEDQENIELEYTDMYEEDMKEDFVSCDIV